MALPNGLYKVEFRTQLGSGSGVVYLHDGKARGGDSGIYYVGTYTQNGEAFSADILADRYDTNPAIQNVFGIDRVHINISGNTAGTSATLRGTAKEAPGVTFQAILTKLSD